MNSKELFEDFMLYTNDGKEIQTVRLPKFRPLYDVIVWGSRLFAFHPEEENYMEVSAVVALTKPGEELPPLQ